MRGLRVIAGVRRAHASGAVTPARDPLDMCKICDGYTPEEVTAMDAETIAEHGYLLQAVGDSDVDFQSWIYTVGLLDLAGHPELIVAGAPVGRLAPVISSIARAVVDGEVFAVGDTVSMPIGIGRVGSVHERHYELDTFAHWHALQDYGAVKADDIEAVQIVLPEAICTARGRSWQPIFANPHALVRVAAGPNRRGRH